MNSLGNGKEQSMMALQPSTSIVNFIPLQKIGQGSFSSVYKVRRITDDRIYALKKIKIASLKQKEKQNALNQIRILASIDSAYIVQYKEAFFDDKLNLLCIVMEYANNGDLQKKVESYRKCMTHIPENQIWKAAYHTLKGLQILHSKSILHRDIKSANIFIADGVYKLGDLNVSKVQDKVERLAYTQTGTPYYASPEVWRDQPYDSKSDIWSLGCVLYEMCTYRPPFKGKDLESLYKSVQRGLYEPLPAQYSNQLSQLISYCLRLNPKQRLTCKQLLTSEWMMQKVHSLRLSQQKDQLEAELLQTIQLPKDLKDLRKKLPKSKYSSSTDHISYQNEETNQFLDLFERKKDKSNHDYYLQAARKKKDSINLQPLKLNRNTYEQNNGNPQENNSRRIQGNPPHHIAQSNRDLSDIKSQDRKRREVNVRSSTRCSETGIKEIVNQNRQDKCRISPPSVILNDKYLINLKKSEDNKVRKLSHDQDCQKSKREMLNHLSLIKKLSQPQPSNNSLSQRYISSDIMLERERERQRQTENPIGAIGTDRRFEQESLKRLLISKKNEELVQIEKKIQEKRRQLRKIGSIQRLQGNPPTTTKNSQNLSYRPAPPLGLKPHLKKSTAHLSNILLKSPVSTQDQQLSHRMRQKISTQKKLSINLGGVSAAPYLIRLGEVGRVKGLLDNINEAKKNRETQIRNKIVSSRYLKTKE